MNVGDKIQLKNQEVEVIACKDCGKNMVNIDAEQLASGDLAILKKSAVLVSNPETDEPICINCEYKPSFGHRLAEWFNAPTTSSSDDDDSSFFHSSGTFLGSSSYGGFSGGSSGGSSFGGFGGGSFSGGGASGGF